MKVRVERGLKKPAYLQLYESLRRDIESGVYRYGERLPSKRVIADESGVSVITAEHAYAILCDEGYAEARKRSGYFVCYVASRADSGSYIPVVRRAQIHSSSGEFPFSVLARTMRKVIADKGDSLLVKSPNHGCAELRCAIVNYLLRSNGISVLPEQIIIGSGAEYLYSLIAQLLGGGHRFALESPSYDKIRRVYEANGVRCDMLKLGADGIKSSELERTDASVLHVTPFNSFPSHITASASKRSEYIRFASERNGYIIEDNYDAELTLSTKNEDTLYALCNEDRVIYLNTFSKTIAPSVRIGYMVLPEPLLADFESKLGFYSCTVPLFEQYVLAELISSGDFQRHINRIRRIAIRESNTKRF